MSTTSHPSFLELDRLRLGAGSAAAQEHVAQCAPCCSHLSRLDLPAPLPNSLHQLVAPRLASWRLWAGLALAATFSVLAVARTSAIEQWSADGVQAKGGKPAIAVFIKRGEQVSMWDGKAAVRPGDLLRLEVAAEGYRRVRVTTAEERTSAELLYEGRLESDSAVLLPVSFEVDTSGATERLDIALFDGSVPGETWSTRLVLEKSAARGETP